MKGNVIQMNTLHLNSVRLNGIGKVQSVSLKGGSTEDPVFPPVEPPVEPTPTYTLSASVTNGKVSATLNGSAVNLPFTANEGDTIIVEVTPNDGYSFEGWADGNTDNPRTITMTADVVLSAECVEVVAPPVGNYIQFEDKAVEAICVANWSSDGIGLTEEDAAAVTTIGTIFKGNTAITSFNEFEYFTGVTSLTTSAFYSCSSLKAIKFPSSVTGIGVQAFYGCSALEGDLLLENVTTIGHNAFNGCKKLTSVYAPVLGSIPQDGFRYCSGLQSVELGNVVTSIGIRGLRDCTGLQKIIVRAATPPTLGADALTSTNSCPIYVPDASLEAYKTAVNWSAYADRIHPLSEIEDYYISDALLMHLDGINKGNVEGEWQDLVSGNTFVNHGAVAEADGWEFDGATSFMESSTITNYGWKDRDRTLEVVVEFANAGVTDIIFAGRWSGMAFGRYAQAKQYVFSMDNIIAPTLLCTNDDFGKKTIAIALTDTHYITSVMNGQKASITGEEYFGGVSASYLYLGKRSTGDFFKGKIHAIRIHDRILSEEEILYNQRIDNKRFNLGLDI